MFILLAITLWAANDNVNATLMRAFSTSDECIQAKQLLEQGKTFGVGQGVTHYFCARKPK